MFFRIIITFVFSVNVFAQGSKQQLDLSKQKHEAKAENEVIENPSLQSLSGALSKLSLYSSYSYQGGSLNSPLSAERPNIQNAEEVASLANLRGNFGLKYRLNKKDNISVQLGVYATTPFHSNLNASDARTQNDFDKNHQNIDFDDPLLSYFRTFHMGSIQNISFVKYQYVTRSIYRDYGLQSIVAFNHAAAYRLTPASYLAATFTYEKYIYDKDTAVVSGREVSLSPYQTENRLRSNIAFEYYFRRNLSFRAITDLFSFYQMKNSSDISSRTLQQTVAMTYFFTRDISIAPNLRFIISDLRDDRSNLGFSLNINL